MAIAAATVWEVRPAGGGSSDSNGGGFVTGATGTDRSQQDAAQATLSASSVVHTTTTQINVAVGDFTVSAADVGNLLQVTGGTATAGFYQITTVDVPNNRWTVDRAVGTAGQTVVGAMGGALASPGKAAAAQAASNTVWVKAGTYAITSASTNVAGGCVSLGNGTRWEGYNATRGDQPASGSQPVLQASGIGTATLLAWTGSADPIVRCLTLDGANLTAIRGMSTGRGVVSKCVALNCTNSGIATVSQTLVTGCLATGCSTTGGGFNGGSCLFLGCEAYANSVPGFAVLSGGVASSCLSYGNSGASSHGFSLAGVYATTLNCVAYGNGGAGFNINQLGDQAVNCLAEGNTGAGFQSGGTNSLVLRDCGAYGNSGGATGGTFAENTGFVTGGGSFFTNAATGDFSLNNTASAGRSARAAGYPGVFPRGLTTGHVDIGAAQHADAGGGVSRARAVNTGGI